jgi:hypothetical protein
MDLVLVEEGKHFTNKHCAGLNGEAAFLPLII